MEPSSDEDDSAAHKPRSRPTTRPVELTPEQQAAAAAAASEQAAKEDLGLITPLRKCPLLAGHAEQGTERACVSHAHQFLGCRHAGTDEQRLRFICQCGAAQGTAQQDRKARH